MRLVFDGLSDPEPYRSLVKIRRNRKVHKKVIIPTLLIFTSYNKCIFYQKPWKSGLFLCPAVKYFLAAQWVIRYQIPSLILAEAAKMYSDSFALRTCTFSSGERYPVLLDAQGIPHWYATLFSTTQMRNQGRATNTLLSMLSCLRSLFAWAEQANIDLEGRFTARKFLQTHEIEGLNGFLARARRADSQPAKVIAIRDRTDKPSQRNAARAGVLTTTRYLRLTYVAQFVTWYAARLVEQSARHIDSNTHSEIEAMGANIRARRPVKRQNATLTGRRGLDAAQRAVLLAVIEPKSADNPFSEEVRLRNQLAVHLLFYLGIRAGELLGLRIDDINFQQNTLVVARRHGDSRDPRRQQPVAKTQARCIPVSDDLIRAISHYVLHVRRHVQGAKRHGYLFVTHRSGTFEGAPLSLQGLCKMFRQLQVSHPLLRGVTAHIMRHTANDRFSELMEAQRVEPAKEEKMRSYLMGWKEGSGSAATYTRRHIEAAALRVGLALQNPDLDITQRI